MRVLAEALLGLGLIGGVSVALVYLSGGRGRLDEQRWLLVPSTWIAVHTTADGSTQVLVQKRKVLASGEIKVLEHREVAVIDNHDPDYEEKFSRAMALARERAAVLDASGGND